MRLARWVGMAAFVCAGVVLADDPPPPKGKLRAADYKLTAAEYAKAFRNNDAAAAKFKGKVVEISGTVGSAGQGFQGKNSHVSVYTPDPAVPLPPHVRCVNPDPNFFTQFGSGQTLRIKGIYGAFDELTGCEVVEKGPDARVFVPAETLAKDVSTDMGQAFEKYAGKTLVLSGTIAAIKLEPGSDRKFLELKGDGKTAVECKYNDPRVVAKYKVGQAVKVYCPSASVRNGTVPIESCYPLAK